jgi:hypothetical protein
VQIAVLCTLIAALTEKRFFSPAYYYAVGTSGKAVKCHIISDVYGLTIYRPVCLFLYTKLEFANDASQFQYKLWEKHDITVQPVITYIY